MVREYGMSDLGVRAFVNREAGFIYDSVRRDFSEETSGKIDSTVERLVEEAASDAKTLLLTHRDKLDELANVLLSEETIDAKTVRQILGPRPE
jgi:cell division protease FtsH